MNCCNMRVGQHLIKTTMVNSEDIINLLQAVDQQQILNHATVCISLASYMFGIYIIQTVQ